MKLSISALTVAFIIFSFVSCKKDGAAAAGAYPKEVSVTYKVTSTTTNSLTIITYKNETGGLTDVSNASLPFTKMITRTVNKYDDVSLGYGVNPSQTVKLEISVNGQVVKSQENTGAYGAVTYIFE